jgi:tRNA-dihydrouridine synthase B
MECKNENGLRVRGLHIWPPVSLAPMVGLSHSALRSVVKDLGGVGLLYTEMLAAKRLPHDSPIISPLLIKSKSENPLIYQLIGRDVHEISVAVDKVNKLGAQGVDLNLGCPAPIQKRQGSGASLATNRECLTPVLQVIRKKTNLPFSVKIRLGTELNDKKLAEFCTYLEDEGVDLITVHARLHGEKFCRKPKWDAAAITKRSVHIPVFINGGIFSVEDARQALEESCADGVLVGWGAVVKPWLCRDIAENIYGVKGTTTLQSKSDVYTVFLQYLEERFPKEKQLGRLKQFTSYFAGSFTFGHHFGTTIQSCSTIEEAKDLAFAFFQSTGSTSISNN